MIDKIQSSKTGDQQYSNTYAYKFSDCSLSKLLLFKKWANPGLFFIYFRPSEETLQFFTTNKCEKISIQYTVPGFELTTFGT